MCSMLLLLLSMIDCMPIRSEKRTDLNFVGLPFKGKEAFIIFVSIKIRMFIETELLKNLAHALGRRA